MRMKLRYVSAPRPVLCMVCLLMLCDERTGNYGINYGSFCVCPLLLKAIFRLHQVDFEFMLNNSNVSGSLKGL